MTRHTAITVASLAAITAALALPAAASADEAWNLTPAGHHQVHATTGLDAAVVVEAGYARGLRLEPLDRDLELSAHVTLPVVLLDGVNGSLEVAARTDALRWRALALVPRLALGYRAADNATFRADTLTTEAGLLGGAFQPTWFAALEASWDQALFTWLRHSPAYLDVYPQARSGVYANTASRLDLGLQAGVEVYGGVSLGARAGYTLTGALEPIPLVPFYATLSVSGSWD